MYGGTFAAAPITIPNKRGVFMPMRPMVIFERNADSLVHHGTTAKAAATGGLSRFGEEGGEADPNSHTPMQVRASTLSRSHQRIGAKKKKYLGGRSGPAVLRAAPPKKIYRVFLRCITKIG
jgi:hypothetical protein